MIAYLKNVAAVLLNRLRRSRGPAFRDQCAKVIMKTCTLQLERDEFRELAPTPGATGPMVLSGGAITTFTYSVFDKDADKIDKAIKHEPWRAFAKIVMRVTIEKDPEFEVEVEGAKVEPRAIHKAPGLELIKHLSQYFPLIPKTFQGQTYAPEVSQ